jgi:hypothetical protein
VRNAFFALLFLNLAYFAWAHWVDTPQTPPVNEAIARLPQLKLVEELPPSERPKPNTTQVAPAPASACLSVGPFAALDNSARAASLLRAKGFDPKQRAEQVQTADGYWVYVGGINSQAEVDRALVALEKSGIKDAIVMPETPDAGRRLSLGLYSERPRADRRAQAVRETGLKAEVAEHKIPSTTYWVDLAPRPGMTTVPIQDLYAEGVNSRIAVQPCPAAAQPAGEPPAGSAPAPGVPPAAPAPAAAPATVSNPPAPTAGGAKLP